MSFASALAEIDAINQIRAEVQTFGHLAPENGRTYTGTVLFLHAPYGGALEPLAVELRDDQGEELPDSPFFYDDLIEQISTWLDEQRDAGDITDGGQLYLFTGTYRRTYTPPRPDDQTDEEYDAWDPEPGSAIWSGIVDRVDLTVDVLSRRSARDGSAVDAAPAVGGSAR